MYMKSQVASWKVPDSVTDQIQATIAISQHKTKICKHDCVCRHARRLVSTPNFSQQASAHNSNLLEQF